MRYRVQQVPTIYIYITRLLYLSEMTVTMTVVSLANDCCNDLDL